MGIGFLVYLLCVVVLKNKLVWLSMKDFRVVLIGVVLVLWWCFFVSEFIEGDCGGGVSV